PSDTVARYFAMYEIELNRQSLGIKNNNWHQLTIEWNLEKKNSSAILYLDGKQKSKLPLHNWSQLGLSYAHFISGNIPDEQGIDIEWVKEASFINKTTQKKELNK
ncbi:MAG: hypothetical protein RR471_13395, partial [Bacteroides sp.]